MLARVACAAALLTIIFGIGLPLVGDGVFLGVGMLRDAAPWSAQANASHPTTVFSDTVDFYAPQQDLLAAGARHLRLPLWNPYVSGGVPLGAIPDTGALSPFAVVRALLPDRLAPAWEALFSLAGAVGFTYLFLRRLGLRAAAAWLGGAVYATSGFIVSWTNWPHARIAALFPALFWAVDRVMVPATSGASFEPDNRAQTTPLTRALPVAIVVAAMWFEGFPSVTGYCLYGIGAYVLYDIVRSHGRAWRAALVAVGGVLLGTAIAVVQLLPFALRLSNLDISYRDQSTNTHLPFAALASSVMPFAFGSPVAGNYYGPKNLIETQSFLGGAAIVLVLVAIAARPPVGLRRGARGFWIGVCAVCVALVYGGGLPLALAVHLPVFSNNFVGRLRSLLLLALAVLAAIGFERVLEGARATTEADARLRWRRAAGAAAAGVVGAVILWALAHAARAARRAPSSQWSYFVRHAVIPGAAIAATAILVVLALRASSARRVQRLMLAVPCIVAIEALAFVVPWWPRVASADYYPATPTTQFLAAHLDGDRYAADNDTLFPSANAAYKLRAVSGHAFKEPAWRELVASIDPTQPQGSTVLTVSEADKTATSPILDRLAARYFVAQPGVPVYGARTPPPASRSTFELTDGEATTFSDHGPLRAVVVRAPQGFARRGTPAYLDATVRDASGKVVAHGRRPLLDLPPIDIDVAVPGDALGSGTHTVTLRLDAPGRTLTLSGTPAAPAHGTVRPPAVDDGLRVRFADDTVIYERTNALARVHWASHAIVERSAAARLDMLHKGYNADAVLLNGPSPAASGDPARVAVQDDDGDSMRVAVDAQGAGYLVVADAIQQGWKASVDGRPVPLRPADGAVAAVAVGAGSHVVHLWYDPDGRKPALVVSLVAVLVCVALAAMMVSRRRRPPTVQESR